MKIKKEDNTEAKLKGMSEEIVELFGKINSIIFNLTENANEIKRYTTKASETIIYSTSKCKFLELHLQNNVILLYLKTKGNKIDDPKNILFQVPPSHKWHELNKGIYIFPQEFGVKYNSNDLKNLIVQSYNNYR